MSLIDLIDNSLTDKNTTHSYLELYESLLSKKKYTAENILEVGIGDFGEKNGGSIKLWKDYFINAKIYGIDILSIERVIDELKYNDRVILYTSTDAYNDKVVNDTFIEKNIKFDFVLDDGPHTLDSMIKFIELYSKLLKDDGILIIEDVPTIDWIEILTNKTPIELQKCIQVYDRREIKGQYNDIVFVINKSE
jgi:hypothetical protein